MIDGLYGIIWVQGLGDVWTLFCELRNILPKALSFITEYLNSANERILELSKWVNTMLMRGYWTITEGVVFSCSISQPATGLYTIYFTSHDTKCKTATQLTKRIGTYSTSLRKIFCTEMNYNINQGSLHKSANLDWSKFPKSKINLDSHKIVFTLPK